MKKLLMLLLVLCCVDCRNVISNYYYITIDQAFDDRGKTAIYRAIDMWTEALDGQLTIMYTRQGQCEGKEREICFVLVTQGFINDKSPNPGAIALENWDWGGNPISYIQSGEVCKIWISLNDYADTPDKLAAIMAHELGHGMGLKHIQEKNIMYYNTDGWVMTPSCDDVAQWLDIRHEDVHTRLCPNGGSYTLEHNP